MKAKEEKSQYEIKGRAIAAPATNISVISIAWQILQATAQTKRRLSTTLRRGGVVLREPSNRREI